MHQHKHIGVAVSYLRNHLVHINTVSEWACGLGYSRSYFSVLIKGEFGKPPRRILYREKYQIVKKLVREDPERKGIIIARKTGFANVKSLYKFLHRHYDTSLTELRKQAKFGFLG